MPTTFGFAFSQSSVDVYDHYSDKFSKSELEFARKYPDYFTLNPESIKVTLYEVVEEKDTSYIKEPKEDPKDQDPFVIIDQIINIASKIWAIVEKNKPVVDIDTKYATAVPEGISAWTQLSEWKKPKTYIYGFYAENLYGSVMIDLKYKVTFTYGGKYKGKGLYLTGVTVVPTTVSVGWGYRLGISAFAPDSTIANVGTHESPVASMQLKLTWKISTPIKEQNGTSVYYIEGNGYFEEIASPFKEEADAEKKERISGYIKDAVKEWRKHNE
ncbi:MAG: hypothetical protein HY746_09060 [Elusimicrobia bacterium]|nr:hypothetical protein [Elusimicrobiota bacterium]